MGKSGQRVAHTPVIDKPEYTSLWRLIIEGSIALGLCSLLFCLTAPVLGCFLNYFNILLLQSVFCGENNFMEFLKILSAGGFFVLAVTSYSIIDKPELKSPLRYFLEGSLTTFLWSVWLYWVSPLVTALLWFAGIEVFYTELISGSGFRQFIQILESGGLLVLALTLLIIGWVYYNYLWFIKRGERRNKSVRISFDEDIAVFYNLDPQLLKEAKKAQRIEAFLKDDGIEFHIPPPTIQHIDLPRHYATK